MSHTQHLRSIDPARGVKQIVGAKAKDRTETALNMAVCNGTMTLQEAQHIIATVWFKYYRDHVLK